MPLSTQPRVVRDSRINRFYATQGMLVDFTADFFSQGLGSKYSFQSYKFTAPGVDKFRSDQFLPAGGTGIRFLLSKQYHVNLRTDFAWGKDTFTWSVGVAEAF